MPDLGDFRLTQIGKEVKDKLVGDPAGAQDAPTAGERGGHGAVCGW